MTALSRSAKSAVRVAAALVVVIAGASRPAFGRQADSTPLPSVALRRLLIDLDTAPSRQAELAGGYVLTTRKHALVREERFALAELYFRAFHPDAASGVFQTFVQDADLLARTARQRLLRMKMAAFGDFSGVEEEIRKYRVELPAIPNELAHLSVPVFTLAAHYRDLGNHRRVVDLIMEEVMSLPRDVPYFSFRLPFQFFDSFVKVGEADKARAFLLAVCGALTPRIEALERTVGSLPTIPSRMFPPPGHGYEAAQVAATGKALLASIDQALNRAP